MKELSRVERRVETKVVPMVEKLAVEMVALLVFGSAVSLVERTVAWRVVQSAAEMVDPRDD